MESLIARNIYVILGLLGLVAVGAYIAEAYARDDERAMTEYVTKMTAVAKEYRAVTGQSIDQAMAAGALAYDTNVNNLVSEGYLQATPAKPRDLAITTDPGNNLLTGFVSPAMGTAAIAFDMTSTADGSTTVNGPCQKLADRFGNGSTCTYQATTAPFWQLSIVY